MACSFQQTQGSSLSNPWRASLLQTKHTKGQHTRATHGTPGALNSFRVACQSKQLLHVAKRPKSEAGARCPAPSGTTSPEQRYLAVLVNNTHTHSLRLLEQVHVLGHKGPRRQETTILSVLPFPFAAFFGAMALKQTDTPTQTQKQTGRHTSTVHVHHTRSTMSDWARKLQTHHVTLAPCMLTPNFGPCAACWKCKRL